MGNIYNFEEKQLEKTINAFLNNAIVQDIIFESTQSKEYINYSNKIVNMLPTQKLSFLFMEMKKYIKDTNEEEERKFEALQALITEIILPYKEKYNLQEDYEYSINIDKCREYEVQIIDAIINILNVEGITKEVCELIREFYGLELIANLPKDVLIQIK